MSSSACARPYESCANSSSRPGLSGRFDAWSGKIPRFSRRSKPPCGAWRTTSRSPPQDPSPRRATRRLARLFRRLRLPDCLCPTETSQNRRGSFAAHQPRLARRSVLKKSRPMKTQLSKWSCYLAMLLGLCAGAHAQANSGSNGRDGGAERDQGLRFRERFTDAECACPRTSFPSAVSGKGPQTL